MKIKNVNSNKRVFRRRNPCLGSASASLSHSPFAICKSQFAIHNSLQQSAFGILSSAVGQLLSRSRSRSRSSQSALLLAHPPASKPRRPSICCSACTALVSVCVGARVLTSPFHVSRPRASSSSVSHQLSVLSFAAKFDGQ